MNISETGYTDSYGGLISALEAKERSERGKKSLNSQRLTEIANIIKKACDEGYPSYSLYLSHNEANILRKMGYIILDSYTLVPIDLSNNYVGLYSLVVQWDTL